jgi:microcystin-dependent protein
MTCKEKTKSQWVSLIDPTIVFDTKDAFVVLADANPAEAKYRTIERKKITVLYDGVGDPDNPADYYPVKYRVGELKLMAVTVDGSGWLECLGQVLLRADQAALFTAISTDFNTGGESGTEFRLPNFQQRVPMGDSDPGVGSGSNSVTLTESQLPSHDHNVATTLAVNSETGEQSTPVSGYLASSSNTFIDEAGVSQTLAGLSVSEDSVGSGTSIDITPSHTLVSYWIYAGV